MPEPLEPALGELRTLLLDVEHLVSAVASGRRRGAAPAHARADLRPVRLAAGLRLQVVTSDGRTPSTRNLGPGPDAGAAVDALLAEPFGSWHVRTLTEVVQLRVTKRGEAQVHREALRAPASADPAATAHDRVKQHLIDPGDPLFAVLGADGEKRRQVDAFLRQLAPLARRVAPSGRPLRVLDLGCGNAYLTMAAHRYLAVQVDPLVRTLGVDVRPEAATRNARLAAELGMPGLTFAAAAIEDVALGAEPVDLVLSLHACDTATDDALALAVRRRAAGVLAAPCCHQDVQRRLRSASGSLPMAGLTRHAILAERFADVLTDALRAAVLRLVGYRVDVVEFVDSRHTPRNALIRAIRTGAPPDDDRVREYRELVDTWQVEPALARRLAESVAPVLAAPTQAAPVLAAPTQAPQVLTASARDRSA